MLFQNLLIWLNWIKKPPKMRSGHPELCCWWELSLSCWLKRGWLFDGRGNKLLVHSFIHPRCCLKIRDDEGKMQWCDINGSWLQKKTDLMALLFAVSICIKERAGVWQLLEGGKIRHVWWCLYHSRDNTCNVSVALIHCYFNSRNRILAWNRMDLCLDSFTAAPKRYWCLLFNKCLG